MSCLSCQSISGEKRISPGRLIFEKKYWIIDHAYPSNYVGWLVIVLKRHCESLHELLPEELDELFQLQKKTITIFREELHSEKEYIACFAEADQFKHIHFHMIAKTHAFPEELKGAKAFSLLKVEKEDPKIKEGVIQLSEKLNGAFTR